jgi:hypothetical protein
MEKREERRYTCPGPRSPRPKAYHVWTQEELDFISANYHILGASALGAKYDVSPSAIVSLKRRKRVTVQSTRLRWGNEKDERLLAALKNTENITEAAKLLGISYHSAEARLRRIGITGRRRGRPWEPEEEQLLEDMVGQPISVITDALNKLCRKMGWRGRAKPGVGNKIREMGYSSRPDDMFSVAYLALSLRADHGAMRTWALNRTKELGTYEEGRTVLVDPKKLRKYFIDYPSEIGRFKPDPVWLVMLISNKY